MKSSLKIPTQPSSFPASPSPSSGEWTFRQQTPPLTPSPFAVCKGILLSELFSAQTRPHLKTGGKRSLLLAS